MSSLLQKIKTLETQFTELNGNSQVEYSTNQLYRNYPYTSSSGEVEETVGSFSLLKGKHLIKIFNRCVFQEVIGDYIVQRISYSLYEQGTTNRVGRAYLSVGYKPSEIGVVYQEPIMLVSLDEDMVLDLKIMIIGGLEEGGSFWNTITLGMFHFQSSADNSLTISSVNNLQTSLDSLTASISTNTNNITSNLNVLTSLNTSLSLIQTQQEVNTSGISNIQTLKQDKLTAGDNITIDENNVISSSSGGGSASFIGFRAVAINKGGITTPIGNISYLLDNTNTPPYSYDTDNLYDTTTGTFLPNKDGYWQVGFKFYNNNGEGTTFQTNQLKLRRGGVELGPIIFAGNHNGQAEDVNTCVNLFVGDEIYITHEGNTSLYVFNASNNFFEARFIGV